ncbi:efflux RND transporter permease subunit [Phyllobacterium sp. OV277]|uniref:efflux RND transporter permease subunit n=1 Tax=Phyllobacterium sp. OV277 TaxID=1882772 RepID=UPI000887C0D7|nr:efflux RND transporter permease subunit [Phyllobacterium sp. OV277]SDN76229.1 multidrug efflux pump [Phyllobacterium sp. OV277]
MNFSDVFIRRPVLSTVVALMIILLGAQGVSNLAVRQYPKVDETAITITTTYAGASADLMQGFISAPIAKAVTTTENIDYVTSSSVPSSSTVTVQMKLGADPDAALTEVISKVNQVRGDLPTEADDPVIKKGTGQEFATMYLAVQNPNMSSVQLTEYLQRVIQPRMSTIQGVADAQVLGGQVFSMRVWIDPIQLAARKTTASEVLTAIKQSNFLSAPGKIENLYVASPITLKTTLQTPEAFGAMPIKSDGTNIVRLRDVARIELGAVNTDTRVTFNGSSGTFLGIFPTPSANPLDMTAAVRKELPAIDATLPEGMSIIMLYDSTEQISSSIEEVFKTIGEAVLIVVLVILLFLGSFRSVIIPVVTIPISLVGVCFFLFLLGYSINLLSLLAMVLAIGLVVDDAIVVLENIHRHIEEGLKPIDAALKGMKEITGPIIAMTITLAAVFAPLGFTGGLTGALFREFAFTLAGAVIISGVAALTVSPMMCALLLKSGNHSRFQRIVDNSFSWLEGAYERRVAGSLAFRPITLFIVIALVALTAFLFNKTSSELAPEEDSGFLVSLVNAPQYATTDYTQLYANQIDALTKDLPELKARFNIAGLGTTNSAFAIWVFKDWAQREKSQKQLQQELQGMISPIAGAQAYIFALPTLPGTGGGLPISVVIQSTGPADKVFEVAEEIKNKVQASGKFIVAQNSLSFNAPQVTVTIDRDRASALGIPVSEIGQTLGLLVGGGKIAKFDRDSNSYDIIPQVPQDFRSNPENLGKYFVKSSSGDMVPLSAVIKVTENASPAAIEQFNQLNSATISALPMPGVTTGEGLKAVVDTARPLMPNGFFLDYTGQSRLEVTQGNTILIAFVLAIVVIYLVLAAQFESFRDPFIIMMSVPLSIFGAIVPLNMGLGTLNIYTQVGLITLVGLITKHGILMVEFANQQRELHGISRHDAIILAAKTRLRPILMTTAAMALGVIPLITATGAGAAARYSIGLVIFSGILVGTIFTLFVVPMFYTFISHKDHKVETVTKPQPGAEPQPSHT